jgi:hypothetical protein
MKLDKVDIQLVIDALKTHKAMTTDRIKIQGINESIKYFESLLPEKKIISSKHSFTKPDKAYHYVPKTESK